MFQTNSINSGTQTITAEGINIHNITLPNNTSGKKRFDIIVAGAGSPATSLASSVPDAHGEASIIQEGISTLTITTQTYAGGFGGMVNTAVTRPTNVTKEPTTITTTGGTAGVTTTLITLDTNTTGIQTGMVITGTGVSHGTTVVAFEDDRFVTASQNATITDGTTLNFSLNDGNIKTFELTVTPTGEGTTLSIDGTGGSRQPTENDFSTSNAVEIATHPSSGENTQNSSTLTLETTVGILPGMTFTLGSGDSAQKHTVSSIVNASRINISPNLTAGIAASTNILFENENAPIVELRHVEAVKVQNNIVIRGLLEVSSLPANDTINIYLDNFIHTE